MGTGQGRCGEAGEGLGEQQRVRSLAGAMISLLSVLVAPQHLQVPEPPEEQLHCSSSTAAAPSQQDWDSQPKIHTKASLETCPEVTWAPQNWGNSACCLSFSIEVHKRGKMIFWTEPGWFWLLYKGWRGQAPTKMSYPISQSSSIGIKKTNQNPTFLKIPFSNKTNVLIKTFSSLKQGKKK